MARKRGGERVVVCGDDDQLSLLLTSEMSTSKASVSSLDGKASVDGTSTRSDEPDASLLGLDRHVVDSEIPRHDPSHFPGLAAHQDYKPGSLKARIVALLNDCLEAGQFPRSRNRMQIRRDHFSDLLGITKSALTKHVGIFASYEEILEVVEPLEAFIDGIGQQSVLKSDGLSSDSRSVAAEVVRRFPSLAIHQDHTPGSTRGQLVRMLNDCVMAGHFPTSRKTRIARTHFAERLKVSLGTVMLSQDILASYDAILPEFVSTKLTESEDAETSDAIERTPEDDVADEVVRRFPDLVIHQSYKSGSTKAKLVALLNDCLVAGKFPRSRNKREISRTQFTLPLDVTSGLLSSYKEIFASYEAILEEVEPYDTLRERLPFGANSELSEPMDSDALEVVSRYPELLKHQHYPVGHTARDVVLILNSQLCGEGLVRSRGGKISRQVLTDHLGLSQPAMTPHLAILTDYEDATGGRESKVELLIPTMRLWFEQNMQTGTLDIRDGKVSRVQFYQAFDLPTTKTTLIRYPRVAEVVYEFDKRVADTGYLPSGVASKVKDLEALLADEPPIDKSGRSINITAISRSLGIPFHQIKLPPYSVIIAEAQDNLIRVLEEDPLSVFACGRMFQFKSLVQDGWPKAYAVRIASCFERSYRAKDKGFGKTRYALLMDLLSFFSTNSSQLCRSVFYGLGNGVPVSELSSEFTRALQSYRDHVREKNDLDATCNAKLKATNSVIRTFSANSVLPEPYLYLKEVSEGGKRHYKTIVEAADASAPKTGNPNVDDYLVFATAMLKQAAEVREIEVASAEAGDFTRVLREELEADTFGAADNPASVILRVLERRLSLIKAAAWAKVEDGLRKMKLGQMLLSRAVDPGSDFDRIINGDGLTRPDRDALLRRYFPKGENEEQGIANLLKVVETRCGKIYPSSQLEWEGRFFAKRVVAP